MSGTRQRGYTLIEILIAVGIFIVLLGTVGGIFATFLRGQRSTLAQSTLLGDVQTFLELLEREVRTGYGSTFEGGGARFSFTNQNHESVTYSLVGGQAAAGGPTTSGGPAALGGLIMRNEVKITTPAVAVTDLDFTVTRAGVDAAPGASLDRAILSWPQGRVTVRVRVCPSGIDDGRCLVTQTTLTSRQYGPAA